MARFARDCLLSLSTIVSELETTLGPGTAELGMRFGIHSGQVTAGVLRGERTRFQLFGDTVNVASRMESTGAKNKVQLSEEAATVLIGSGKGHWVIPREEMVEVKGKGAMQTYWLLVGGSGTEVADVSNSADMDLDTADNKPISTLPPKRNPAKAKQEKLDRLIDWNMDLLERMLKKIVAMRGDDDSRPGEKNTFSESLHFPEGASLFDEVKEIMTLPRKPVEYKFDPSLVSLDPLVVSQLREYVRMVADNYSDRNPFHNFEHASHVTQSVSKLLARVVTPDQHGHNGASNQVNLHEYTHGITSDPLTQFSLVFSALIHDLQHPGVPNTVLIKEENDMAKMYKNKSVAEQHSVAVGWDLLMEPNFANLRACIYSSQKEFERFRQLVVNVVLATDIADPELNALRRNRWQKAFTDSDPECPAAEDANRKATIVMEHLIAASDVAHTMQ